MPIELADDQQPPKQLTFADVKPGQIFVFDGELFTRRAIPRPQDGLNAFSHRCAVGVHCSDGLWIDRILPPGTPLVVK